MSEDREFKRILKSWTISVSFAVESTLFWLFKTRIYGSKIIFIERLFSQNKRAEI